MTQVRHCLLSVRCPDPQSLALSLSFVWLRSECVRNPVSRSGALKMLLNWNIANRFNSNCYYKNETVNKKKRELLLGSIPPPRGRLALT